MSICNDVTLTMYYLRTTLLPLFIVIATAGSAQDVIVPVSFRIKLDGEVSYQTIDPTFPLEIAMGRVPEPDSSYKLKAEDGKRHFCYNEVQLSYLFETQTTTGIDIYPPSEQTDPGNNFYRVNDTLIERNYMVDASFCNFVGHYFVQENWHLDEQGKVKDIYTHRTHYGDTVWTHWSYTWHSDGRLDRIVKSKPVHSYSLQKFDTTTLQMKYDEDKRLTGEYMYNSAPIDSLETYLRDWNSVLSEINKQHKHTQRLVHDNVLLLASIQYSYSEGRLTNVLSFSHHYTTIISDELVYDQGGRLKEHIQYNNARYSHTVYTYNSNNKLAERTQLELYDYRYPNDQPNTSAESYHYKSKMISEIHWSNTSTAGTTGNIILVEYPSN